MHSETYRAGFDRGSKMLSPMHHNLSHSDMRDYLDGFRAGQAKYLSRTQALRGRPPFMK